MAQGPPNAPGHRPSHHLFKSERQAKFRQSARKEVLDAGHQRKAEERRRMEEYRKLCKREGVHSKRLEDYDEARREQHDRLEQALHAIDHDPTLSNSEKRKRKFSAKQKLAATSINEFKAKTSQRANVMAGVERIQRRRVAERQEKELTRTRNEQQKGEKIRRRKRIQHLLLKKTRKGQPDMNARVQSLLEKLQ